ncbi:ribosome maturation factor RimM [Tessaracoccus sp. HDW20]|uniref:ribosome maturation factor RimM n=1 Tax=Tessaracoccus coleopterorum TaxID=2714950 RepID=UPI0018D4691E|nr:ribosome maturation factor RimM [Tessaracoccus coleopterorum]NHB85798.1 ribosome maturation factor RimM [Tessaracoccus coleopterorum]
MTGLVEVRVGKVGRPHGIKGDVAIDLRTDEPARRFTVGGKLRLGDTDRSVEIGTVRWHKGRVVVSFVGYPDRSAVETLTGQWLSVDVPADERPSEPEEYFDRQLVGLDVLDHTGRRVGTVAEVLHMPAQDLLRLDVDGTERLVPFVSALVPGVDLEEGVIRLADVRACWRTTNEARRRHDLPRLLRPARPEPRR